MVTISDIAAYLGVTPGYIRQIVAIYAIHPAGRYGRAHLYWVADITRHTGHSDRLAQRPDLH
jgi:hypothetical protein